MKLAGMASNRGRNLMNVADRAPGGAEFSVVLSNQEGAPVLEKAAERGIPTEVVPQGDDQSRREHEQGVEAALEGYEFDLLCLDGYMRILTEEFVDAQPTTLNVHPSLLPAFPGLDAHEKVLASGVKQTGCTVHVVDDTVDGGPIVTQEPIPVFEGDDADDLKERVLYRGEFVAYPRAVRWFAEDRVTVDHGAGTVSVDGDEGGAFPTRRQLSDDRTADLRYGENPHQDAALYADHTADEASVVHAPELNGASKGMGHNNYNDADAALNLVKEFEAPACAVIKHTNPAGCAVADTVSGAYADALSTDPKSAYGGIVALNRECDVETAERIIESYKEVVVAPGYTDAALDVLGEKEKLRVLNVGSLDGGQESLTEKKLVGGRLVQERDDQVVTAADLEVVTDREPTDEQIESMLFAWRTIKHVKSNAILFATDTETVGVGAGQVSRIDAVKIAAMKAESDAQGKSADGAVMASDAFFPMPDNIEEAAGAGIEAVIQPGGSVNDDSVIEAADEHDMTMVFTGKRCFKHE